MKTKTILFSNFKFNPTNNNDDDLLVNEMYNVNTSNNMINTEISSKNILASFFDETTINEINQNNPDIIYTFEEIIPYAFFDEMEHNLSTRIFAISNGNMLYELNFSTLIFEEKYTFELKPQIIQTEDYIYLFDSNNVCAVIHNSNTLQIEQIPKIKTFLKTSDKIYFSLNNYPSFVFETDTCNLEDISTNIEQYQKHQTTIEDGEIIKIAKIKNKIYVVTKYSILQLDEEEQTLTKIISNKLSIYTHTIEQIDNILVFYTSNGLYYFDGSDLNQLFDNYLKLDKNANIVCFNRNLYIFSENLTNFIIKFNTGEKSISFIKIDGLKNLYIIKSGDVYNLCACTLSNEEYKNISLYNTNPDSFCNQFISFKATTLGSTYNKLIKSMIIKAEGSFQFSVKSDISSTTFFVDGNTHIDNISLSGTIFYFEISSSNKFSLNSILVTFEEDNS